MGDVITLRGSPTDLNSDEGQAFVVDAVRSAEGLATDQDLQDKYELSPADWITIKQSVELGHKVRKERERRVFTGVAAREAAAKYFVKAPSILDRIMVDDQSHAKHKIEAIRELRQTATVDNADRPMQTDRFVIVIDLSGDLSGGARDVITYDKSIKIDASDGADNPIALEGKSHADE